MRGEAVRKEVACMLPEERGCYLGPVELPGFGVVCGYGEGDCGSRAAFKLYLLW